MIPTTMIISYVNLFVKGSPLFVCGMESEKKYHAPYEVLCNSINAILLPIPISKLAY